MLERRREARRDVPRVPSEPAFARVGIAVGELEAPLLSAAGEGLQSGCDDRDAVTLAAAFLPQPRPGGRRGSLRAGLALPLPSTPNIAVQVASQRHSITSARD